MPTTSDKTETYQQVVEALKAVNALRTWSNADTPERADLDQTAGILEALSWEIISGDLKKAAVNLNEKLGELKELNKKIRESYSSLKSLSDLLTETSDVVSAFITTIQKITDTGLI